MSHNRKILYTLSDEEKKLFEHELSKENIPYILIELKKSFNQTYQYLLNIFKKVFSAKKNNIKLCEDINNYILELQKSEMSVLRQYQIIMLYLQLTNTDIKNAKITMEFENEQEKNEVLKLLKERGQQLIKFTQILKKLEDLREKVNSTYEKMMLKYDLDNLE